MAEVVGALLRATLVLLAVGTVGVAVLFVSAVVDEVRRRREDSR